MIDITQTQALEFAHHGSDGQSLFSVNPGIALEDALTQLSHLLTCAQASATELCDTRVPEPGLLGCTVHCIESAKALVDALLIRR